MRALVQRVVRGCVLVGGQAVGSIGNGYVVFLGVGRNDTEKEVVALASKILDLRLFPAGDKEGQSSLLEVDGGLLVVSQFTLYGDAKKGRRLSFDQAMAGPEARLLYERFVALCRERLPRVETGVFGAMMEVELVNWGPYTVWIETGS